MGEIKQPQIPENNALLADLEAAEKNPEVHYRVQLTALKVGRAMGFSDAELEKTLGIRLKPEDRSDAQG